MAGVERSAEPPRPPGWARWILLLVGVLSIAAGVIVLAQPAIALATLAVVTGIFMLVDGIGETLLGLVSGGERRIPSMLLGVASAVIGVILIRHPIHGVVAVALLLGLWLIIAGIIRLASAFGVGERPIWNAIVALLEMAAGIIIVASPGIGVATLGLLVGISLIARGIGLVALGWIVDRVGRSSPGVGPGGVAAT